MIDNEENNSENYDYGTEIMTAMNIFMYNYCVDKNKQENKIDEDYRDINDNESIPLHSSSIGYTLVLTYG